LIRWCSRKRCMAVLSDFSFARSAGGIAANAASVGANTVRLVLLFNRPVRLVSARPWVKTVNWPFSFSVSTRSPFMTTGLAIAAGAGAAAAGAAGWAAGVWAKAAHGAEIVATAQAARRRRVGDIQVPCLSRDRRGRSKVSRNELGSGSGPTGR